MSSCVSGSRFVLASSSAQNAPPATGNSSSLANAGPTTQVAPQLDSHSRPQSPAPQRPAPQRPERRPGIVMAIAAKPTPAGGFSLSPATFIVGAEEGGILSMPELLTELKLAQATTRTILDGLRKVTGVEASISAAIAECQVRLEQPENVIRIEINPATVPLATMHALGLPLLNEQGPTQTWNLDRFDFAAYLRHAPSEDIQTMLAVFRTEVTFWMRSPKYHKIKGDVALVLHLASRGEVEALTKVLAVSSSEIIDELGSAVGHHPIMTTSTIARVLTGLTEQAAAAPGSPGQSCVGLLNKAGEVMALYMRSYDDRSEDVFAGRFADALLIAFSELSALFGQGGSDAEQGSDRRLGMLLGCILAGAIKGAKALTNKDERLQKVIRAASDALFIGLGLIVPPLGIVAPLAGLGEDLLFSSRDFRAGAARHQAYILSTLLDGQERGSLSNIDAKAVLRWHEVALLANGLTVS